MPSARSCRRASSARLAIALALTLAAGSCSSEPADDSVKIPATTKVLAAETLTALSAVAPDLQTLTFKSDTPQLQALSAGDVLVAGVSGPLLPYGLLRKVQRVDRAGGQVTVTTGPAKLTDAIEKGSLHQTFTLVPERKSSSKADSPANGGFVFGFNNVELYEGIKLNGNVSFKPTVDLDVDIGLFKINTFMFKIGSDQQSSIQITASREATFNKEVVVEQMTLTPITFSIGPVPVVLVPIIKLLIGVDGKVGAGMTTALTADAKVSIGFGYHDGSFSPTSELSTTGQVEVPSFLDGAQAKARAWAGPKVELAAYGLAGVEGALRGYVRGEVDVTANPWWHLYAGVEALAGVFVNIIGIEYATPVVKKEVELKKAEGAAPSHSSTGPVLWARSYGGASSEFPVAITPTKDGGSLLVGSAGSFSEAPADAWVVKLDALGHLSWQRAIEDANAATSVLQTDDEGFLLVAGAVGTSASAVRLIRLDQNGDQVWAKKLSAAKELGPTRLAQGEGGAFFLAGEHGNIDEGDFWLTKVDDQGTVLWSKSYGGAKGERADGLLIDGSSVILAGATHSFNVSFNGQWVIKVDDQGNLVWQETIDGDGNELPHAVVPDGAGGYFLVGSTLQKGLVTRLDASGALSWSNLYDAGTDYDELFDGIASGDGGLFVAGKTDLAEKSNTWMMRLTPAGKVLWSISYGGPKEDAAGGSSAYAGVSRALQTTADGALLCASTSHSFTEQTSPDAWLMKVSPSGTISFDAASGAKSMSLSGKYQSYTQKRAATSATASSVSLTSVSETPKIFSTTAQTKTQAGLP